VLCWPVVCAVSPGERLAGLVVPADVLRWRTGTCIGGAMGSKIGGGGSPRPEGLKLKEGPRPGKTIKLKEGTPQGEGVEN
jgi:hypothetical protein